MRKFWLLPLLVLVVAAPAQARVMLTPHQAHVAARLALDNSLGALVYRGIGTAETHVGPCRVRGRRATCFGTVVGTVTCHVRLRVMVAGHLPASNPNSRMLVWSDRVQCS